MQTVTNTRAHLKMEKNKVQVVSFLRTVIAITDLLKTTYFMEKAIFIMQTETDMLENIIKATKCMEELYMLIMKVQKENLKTVNLTDLGP